MIKKIVSLTFFLACLSVVATGQNGSPQRYVKLVPDGSGGFKAIYGVDTLSASTRLNKKLDTISAAFYQISDSILTFADSDLPGTYFNGSLRNSFSDKHQLSMSYFIRPNQYGGGAYPGIVHGTNRILSQPGYTDSTERDSVINDEYKRFVASRVKMNVLSNGDSCYSKEQAIDHADYDKNMLNADSVIVVQNISPPYGTCAIGLNKDVVIYKRDIGYFVLSYGLVIDWNRQISFQEASNLIDSLIQQTWGIIRFNKD